MDWDKTSEKLQKRIGIMGGTFDPIHMAHLLLAEAARTQFHLDQILFMPSANPPHKDNQTVSPAEHRRAMVLLAVKGNLNFVCSDLEFRRRGFTYTSDTLRALHEQYPDTEFYFIMGADSLFAVDTWHQPEKIFNMATILAGNRSEVPMEQIEEQVRHLQNRFGGRIFLIDMPDIAISSSEIRKRCAEGASVRYYVPETVYQYMKAYHLYVPKDKRLSAAEGDIFTEEGGESVKPDCMIIKEKLRHKLGIGRFEHTLGVAYTAACLAMRYGCSAEDAELAGLLHDCAKQYDNETLMKKCSKYKLPVSEAERKNPSLLHAKLGAYLAKQKYDVNDVRILDAIRYHTTGRPAMTLLEKIIYVADYIEPRRFKAPNLDKIRGLAFVNLDQTVCEIMSDTLAYLKKTPENIDKTTQEACMYYQKLKKEEHA
ncbi:MAG: nicotinate-nucleotide adenylyltransferase [Lachnospiraceae bacterium]|nr:nicotinate-nucleotide adenylyltransferase [Lachnospiraceae bacterium]